MPGLIEPDPEELDLLGLLSTLRHGVDVDEGVALLVLAETHDHALLVLVLAVSLALPALCQELDSSRHGRADSDQIALVS